MKYHVCGVSIGLYCVVQSIPSAVDVSRALDLKSSQGVFTRLSSVFGIMKLAPVERRQMVGQLFLTQALREVNYYHHFIGSARDLLLFFLSWIEFNFVLVDQWLKKTAPSRSTT